MSALRFYQTTSPGVADADARFDDLESPQLAISLYGGLNRMAREESYAASRPEGHAMINHNAQHAGAVGMLDQGLASQPVLPALELKELQGRIASDIDRVISAAPNREFVLGSGADPKSLEEASHILPRTGGRRSHTEDQYDILSSGPFCHNPTRGLQPLRSKAFDGDEADIVTLKQLKGWRRVLVLQRFKKPVYGAGLPPETHRPAHDGRRDKNMCNGAATARSSGDHSRWGNTPVRLRFSTPHWESKTTLEHAKMWTPNQLSNGNVTTPAVLALPTRSVELPLDPQRSSGGRTERILSTAHRKDQGQEHLRHRAEVEVLRLALDTSNRTLEAFGRSQADEGVVWPPHQRWGSLQKRRPPNHCTNLCSFYRGSRSSERSRLELAFARHVPDNILA